MQRTIYKKIVRIYIYTSWLPIASYLFAYFYLETLEGWGQWATVKVLLPSVVLSSIYTIAGLFIFLTKYDKITNVKRFIVSILLSSSIMLWHVIRYLIRN